MPKPTITVPDTDPPTSLEVVDDVVGDGAEASPGSTVSVHYVGVAWSTGSQFDASWDRMEPFSFGLGAGQDEGVHSWIVAKRVPWVSGRKCRGFHGFVTAPARGPAGVFRDW